MKWLKYYTNNNVLIGVDEEGNEVWETVRFKIKVKDNEEGRALAAAKAIGDIVEYDDGKPEYKAPTQLDAIEAQVTYTVMMTGTLLEE